MKIKHALHIVATMQKILKKTERQLILIEYEQAKMLEREPPLVATDEALNIFSD